MIDPVLPAGVIQALTGKIERPPIAISLVSLPKPLATASQPREIGGTVTQASADGSAVLHTAAGDIGIKSPVVLAPGRTATLLLTPTAAGIAAALQVTGAAPPPVQPPESSQGAPPGTLGTTNSPGAAGAHAASMPIRPNTPSPQTAGRPIGDQTSPAAVPSRNFPGMQSSPPRTAPSPAAEQSARSIATPMPHGFPPASAPAPRLQANPGLRDAALLLSQLAVQSIDQPLPPAATAMPISETGDGKPAPAAAATFAAAPMAIANPDSRPLPADPASLLLGLAAALKRPPQRAGDENRNYDAESEDSATPGEAVYRSSGKLSEASESISWRQFQVMDDSRIVPVFLGRHPPEETPEEAPDQSSDRQPPARFTVRFDLQHAGSVRIDSVYRERRLDMLLTLDTAPDKDMQATLRERLAALSDEFGLSISLRIGGTDPAAS